MANELFYSLKATSYIIVSQPALRVALLGVEIIHQQCHYDHDYLTNDVSQQDLAAANQPSQVAVLH